MSKNNNFNNLLFLIKNKTIKYKSKYLDLIGGKQKTNKTLEEFIRDFDSMDNEKIKLNLQKYIDTCIIKLHKLSSERKSKINNSLKLDYNIKNETLSEVRNLGYGEIIKGYESSIVNNNSIIKDYISSKMNLNELYEIIKTYLKIKDNLDDPAKINEYKRNLIELFKDNKVSNAYNEYKLELFEYLLTILNGGEPIGSPFYIVITGNPGLGKSHLAKKVVALLKATYLLPVGDFKNVKKPDVIGQYIGQTAPRVYNTLTKSIGSMVFIDEAYSFAGEKRQDGFDPFGKEFIDALVDFMEEYKGLISIIAAGYEKQMKDQFYDVNPGLARRFLTKLNVEELSPMTIIYRVYDGFIGLKDNKYIENFVRLAYNIEQDNSDNIEFTINEGTPIDNKYNKHIIVNYFNPLFGNNWTDIQSLIDYVNINKTLNNSAIKDINELFNDIICEYMKNKINKDSGLINLIGTIKDKTLLIDLKFNSVGISKLSRELKNRSNMNDLNDIFTETAIVNIDNYKLKLIDEERNNESIVATKDEERRLKLEAIDIDINPMPPAPALSLTRAYSVHPDFSTFPKPESSTGSKIVLPPPLAVLPTNTQGFSFSSGTPTPLGLKFTKESTIPLPSREENFPVDLSSAPPLLPSLPHSISWSSGTPAPLAEENLPVDLSSVPPVLPSLSKQDSSLGLTSQLTEVPPPDSSLGLTSQPLNAQSEPKKRGKRSNKSPMTTIPEDV